MNQEERQTLRQVENLMKKSQYTVVLTGAGMSTESGLPDFRSQSGLWQGKNPEEIASVQALERNREEFLSFYRKRIEQLERYAPHSGHERLTQWQRQGYVQRIITQNVDGFHQHATSHGVLELHGTLREIRCQQCERTFSSERYLQEQGEVCSHCQGFLRPSVVLFGESLDAEVIHHAFEEARKAELFIVMGSSLQVSPANMLPMEALNEGAVLVIINEGETQLDDAAHYRLHGKIGEIVSRITL
ncbi:NAD-dependent deacylase [Caldalkalibacillus mannanilyticus]|uniref:NAD-dependent deacylase n=1 Tax=Caldalkalibacillus mannanilyticus TaxID=1418 RepID=UPI00068753D2|nr:NAD-dependent deacylase [Caldalkalibacillus mannanilyticus]